MRVLRKFKRNECVNTTAFFYWYFSIRVCKKSREKKDGGNSLGSEMLGINGFATGVNQFGFEFSNSEIQKNLKNLAFQEGVIKPMEKKMAEAGEDKKFDISQMAKSVIEDFNAPKSVNDDLNLGKLECAFCGTEAGKKCGKCKAVFYCGVEHQKKDWTRHKKDCLQE